MSIFEQSVETEDSGMAGGRTYYDFESIYQEFKERLMREIDEELAKAADKED